MYAWKILFFVMYWSIGNFMLGSVVMGLLERYKNLTIPNAKYTVWYLYFWPVTLFAVFCVLPFQRKVLLLTDEQRRNIEILIRDIEKSQNKRFKFGR